MQNTKQLSSKRLLSSTVATLLLLAEGALAATSALHAVQQSCALELPAGRTPGESSSLSELSTGAARPVASPVFQRYLELTPGLMAQIVAQVQPSFSTQQGESNGSDIQPLTLTEQIIRDVFGPLQRALEEHNLAHLLAVFDQEETPDYAQLRDQFKAFFQQYETVGFRYKVLQVTSEKNRAFAIAEIDMAAAPADQTQIGVQRRTQMRFQMKLGAKGWKLVGFKPGDFFTQ